MSQAKIKTASAALAERGNARAVDRVAARVMRSGTHWDGKVNGQRLHSDTPMPAAKSAPPNSQVQIGQRFGRFVVVGYAGNTNKDGARWLVRCACGAFEHRRSRAITKLQDPDECCTKCDYLKRIKRRAKFDSTGRWE